MPDELHAEPGKRYGKWIIVVPHIDFNRETQITEPRSAWGSLGQPLIAGACLVDSP